MTKGVVWLCWVCLSFASVTALAQETKTSPSATESKPVELTVLVQSAATLEVQGIKVAGEGPKRLLLSPPLPVGKDFLYNVKATWKEDGKDRVVERQFRVQAGQKVEIDLTSNLSDEDRLLIELTNKEREKAGAPPLKMNEKLCAAARGHSENMARQNVLAHTLDGKQFFERMTDAGYAHGFAGENIAEGAPTPAEAISMWMTSPGHRQNILNQDYKELGVGVAAAANGRKYWTQVFAVPRE
jgi:uncharacterized protein (TIGR03000 family)